MKYLKTIFSTETKKGNLLDIPETIFTIFGVVLVAFIIITFLGEFSTNIKANPSNKINRSEITDTMDSHISKLNNASDYSILLIAILFTAAGFILARFIPSDPTYLIIAYLIMGVFILLSFVISNIYGGMMDNTTFANYSTGTTFIRFLMPKLPYLSIIQMVLFTVGLYSKDE